VGGSDISHILMKKWADLIALKLSSLLARNLYYKHSNSMYMLNRKKVLNKLTQYNIQTVKNCVKLYMAIYLNIPEEVVNAARPSLKRERESMQVITRWKPIVKQVRLTFHANL